MADIAINLKGHDNLTNTVKDAKKAVDDLKYSSTELGKASKEFDRITNSGKPLKRQLAQLKALMADMNLKGLSNTDEFTKMAMKAGELKDAMADASDAVNRFSSDTMNLDAAVQAIQGVAAAGTIATGVMGLLGSKNEKVEKAILKVQSALAILNGVQAIANTLNKDSALMQRIKAIRLAATTATTTANTAATTANTIATTANTTATVANTVAQRAWNTAKAIGKAMFGDFTGLVLLGVTAIATYAIATSDATESEKQRNKALEDGKRKQRERSDTEQKYASTVAQSASTQIAAYLSLQQKWRECGNDLNKQKQFMTLYKDELNKTGFAVNSLSDAENFFVKNTNAVLQAITARAEAQANYELMVERLKKGLEKTHEKSIQSGAYYQNANDNNLTDAERKALQNKFGDNWRKSTYRPSGGGGTYRELGGMTDEAKKWVDEQRKQQAIIRGQKWQQEAMAETMADVNEYLKGYQEANQRAQNIMKQNGLQGISNQKTTSTPKTTTPKTTPKNEEPQALKGSLEALEKELAKIQDSIKKGLIPSGKIKETQERIEQLKAEIENKKIELGIEAKKGSLENLQKELQTIQNALSKGEVNDDLLTTAKKRVEELQKAIKDEKIRIGFELSDDAKEALEKAKKDTQDLKKANEDLGKLKLFADLDISSYEKAVQNVQKMNGFTTSNKGRLDAIQTEMDYNDSLMSQLKELLKIYTKLGNVEGIDKVSSKIATLSQSQGKLTEEAQRLAQKEIDWDKRQRQMQGTAEVAQYLGNSVQSMGNAFSAMGNESAAAMMEMVSATLNGVSQVIPQIMALIAAKQGEAMASGTASAASLPFPANIAAIAAVTATIISTFASILASAQKFANGGIVGGGSTHGDKILTRLNAGEMVLSKRQQKNLFNLLDGNASVGGGGKQEVTLRLKGTDIYGSLKNLSNIKSKVGKKVL